MSEVNGAKVWLKLPGFSIQPGEFAKILLMIFFAGFLVSKRDLFMTAGKRVLGVELPRARDLGPIIIAALACLGILVFEKDLGTALLFFGIVLMMLYVATERVIWVVLGLSMFSVGGIIAYSLFTHVQQRVANWFDPLETYYDLGGGYQIAQGLFGLGTGGMLGTGLGLGRPDTVPESHTDFISAALGEELGLVGLSRDPDRLPAAFHARHAQRPRRQGHVRQTARRWPVLRCHHAGLRDRRRCDEAHSDDRGSRHRSCRRVDHHCWRTMHSSRSCCGSPTRHGGRNSPPSPSPHPRPRWRKRTR